jgi:glycosyltransferase involved in cell wall biosynthesis
MEIHSPANPFLSFVIPVHNEEESLRDLYASLHTLCCREGYSAELIFVDDGSTDGSFGVLAAFAESDPRVKIIKFRRNYGQTAALKAGIAASGAPYIVTLDADLQNDPKDVPCLLTKIEEGFDVVSGWRKDRMDTWLRRFPSRLANRLISHVTGVHLSDYGCTLKVYKREFLAGVPLYGEMHRFIPVFAAWHGARVTELSVMHHPRRYGTSHYGLRRTKKVMLDLLTVKFLHTFIARPMHFFGSVGLWLMGLGVLSGVTSVILKLFDIRDFVDTPLPLLTVFLLIVGILFVLMGLLAELLIRIYFDHEGRTSFTIEKIVQLPKVHL